MQAIGNTALPGKLKIWCLQFGVLPQVLWPLTLYKVPFSTVERMERGITHHIRRLLGVPCSLTSTALRDCLLRLPLTCLTEEFKCAKTRLQMTLMDVGNW